MDYPIVWIIAGSDSSGSAGIQADLKTVHALGVHGCSIITALTAQHPDKKSRIDYASSESVLAQLGSVSSQYLPQAIKLGMLGTRSTIQHVLQLLNTYQGHCVLDTPFTSSSGVDLFEGNRDAYFSDLKKLIPLVTLITPNRSEAELLLGCSLQSPHDIENAADAFIALGAKNVLIKGGHFDNGHFSNDYWSNGVDAFWLCHQRHADANYRGTGCTLASAITAALAQGYSLKDALVIGKMFTTQSIRLSQKISEQSAQLLHTSWPEEQRDLPYLSSTPINDEPTSFPSCGSEPLGLYPILESIDQLKQLIHSGITTAQLRIKNKNGAALEKEIQDSIALCKESHVRLFINDYWELALHYNAYGVHLGQEDINTADLKKIRDHGLRLGISTHCYYEVARAHTYKPSYLACGPIFETNSKIMPFKPQGITALQRWRRTLDYPLVAIGGIGPNNIDDVLTTGADGVAMISAITDARDPLKTTEQLLQLCNTK